MDAGSIWERSSCNSRFKGAVQGKMGGQVQVSDLLELKGDSYLEFNFPEMNINGSDLALAGASSGFMQTSISCELVSASDVIASRGNNSKGIAVSEIDHSINLIPAMISSAQRSTTFASKISSMSGVLDPNGDRAPVSFLGISSSSGQAGYNVRSAKKRKVLSSKISMADNNLSPSAIYRTNTQRNNHIIAERQRREDMNEKFSILRTILPKITKKDKASIVTDTINYVTELKKKVKQLEDFKSLAARKVSKKNYSNFNQEKLKEIKLKHNPAEIEIQSMGSRSVIKVTCRRSRGLLSRTVKALDDCKADVLQSKTITLGNSTLQYFTVQLNPGVTASDDEIIGALEEATR